MGSFPVQSLGNKTKALRDETYRAVVPVLYHTVKLGQEVTDQNRKHCHRIS